MFGTIQQATTGANLGITGIAEAAIFPVMEEDAVATIETRYSPVQDLGLSESEQAALAADFDRAHRAYHAAYEEERNPGTLSSIAAHGRRFGIAIANLVDQTQRSAAPVIDPLSLNALRTASTLLHSWTWTPAANQVFSAAFFASGEEVNRYFSPKTAANFSWPWRLQRTGTVLSLFQPLKMKNPEAVAVWLETFTGDLSLPLALALRVGPLLDQVWTDRTSEDRRAWVRHLRAIG